MLCVTKCRLRQNLERPLLASTWFHVLERTQAGIGKVADERAEPVAASFDVESIQTRRGRFHAKVFYDLKPFRKVYDHTVELAAVAAHIAFPV
jgi:hypothetical protein